MSGAEVAVVFGKKAKPHYVYITYRADEILYVGCTWNPPQRLASHARSSEWFELMDRVDVFGPFSKAEALELERDAIWTLQPTFNKRGKVRASAANEWADAVWAAMESA